MSTTKNLSKEPPRSPRAHLGNYALMPRMIDKGRATLAGTAGEYHFACPLDTMLFEYKGVKVDEVKALLSSGANISFLSQDPIEESSPTRQPSARAEGRFQPAISSRK